MIARLGRSRACWVIIAVINIGIAARDLRLPSVASHPIARVIITACVVCITACVVCAAYAIRQATHYERVDVDLSFAWRQTAWHEAGHAVASIALGMPAASIRGRFSVARCSPPTWTCLNANSASPATAITKVLHGRSQIDVLFLLMEGDSNPSTRGG